MLNHKNNGPEILWIRAVKVVLFLGLLFIPVKLFAQNDVLVSSRFSNQVLRYDGSSGAFVGVFAQGPELLNPNGIAFGSDGNLYVGLGDVGSVLTYDGTSGTYLGEFVSPGSGGLGGVRDLTFGPDGDLYVASGTTDQVMRYSGVDGSFVEIAAQGNGLDGPVGLAFGPSGKLFVGAALTNEVFVFDNGVFEQSFNAGVTHGNAVGLAFNSAGQLLVAQSLTNEVLAFDPTTGNFQGVFINGPAGIPIYMSVSPTGHLFVGAFGTDSVWRYDESTGALVDQFILPGSGGLNGTHDIAFFPGPKSVSVDTIQVTIGNPDSGGVPELVDSDDQYFVVDPVFLTFRYQTECLLDAVSPCESPSQIEFQLESRVFSVVGTVDQKIELFNYDSATYETVDTRHASSTDTSVTIVPTGDPSRFVESGTGSMRARVRYENSIAFWVFLFSVLFLPYEVSIDQAHWSVTP